MLKGAEGLADQRRDDVLYLQRRIVRAVATERALDIRPQLRPVRWRGRGGKLLDRRLLAPDAWIDESATKVGYEISFTRYFYQPQPLRTLEEIRADILALKKETEGLLGEIVSRGA
jgi:hypothetical protein